MKSSVYMRWAKEHAAARYNLANSGILGVNTEDLELQSGDVLVNGPNRDGYPPLLEAIAAKYGVAADQVVPSEGTSGANFLAFAALLEPGDEVLVEQPTYEPLLAALSFLGAKVRRFARRFEDGYHLDLDGLRKAMSDRVRMVVITNPSVASVRATQYRSWSVIGPSSPLGPLGDHQPSPDAETSEACEHL